VAEGVPTTLAARELGQKRGVSLPITEQVFQLLYEGKDPYRAITELMTRAGTSE
jgi:glycerol-3-phosphate dehydrogenase (NAD(P)+)